MEKDWVIIYESNNETKIEIARQLLEESDIESVIINKKDRAYGFGEYELYCIRENVIRAKMLLKEL
ncbi:MAG: putative signal transducing protein [Bacteroidota bacterium]